MGFGAFTGRLMLASVFMMSGAMKLMMHEQGAANPILQYFTPKMDGALGKVHSMIGLQLPVEQEQYANIVFIMGAMELLGGVLFTLNVKLGAVILMGVLLPTSLVMHNFWDFAPSSPAHQIEFMNFAKNVSMFGAFLMFAATPRPGALQAKLKTY